MARAPAINLPQRQYHERKPVAAGLFKPRQILTDSEIKRLYRWVGGKLRRQREY